MAGTLPAAHRLVSVMALPFTLGNSTPTRSMPHSNRLSHWPAKTSVPTSTR